MKIAFITGVNGQDGSYLAELLLEKNYIVYGLCRRTSQFTQTRIQHLLHKIHLIYGDVTDANSITTVLKGIWDAHPTLDRLEIYNLAAQSHVHVSFAIPSYTTQVDALGILNILETVRTLDQKKIRIYQASTSELFGKVLEKPQTETTPFNPQSPYAIAKQYAHWIIKNYRDAYGLFACCGILFNHESPRRGEEYVTRKITTGIANILKGKEDCIHLGNLNSLRDWGHARDYVEAMWMMLQQDTPKEYVIATGQQLSVREFVEKAFALRNIHILWEGEGIHEKGICAESGRIYVRIDSKFFRLSEVDDLLGDSHFAQQQLGWYPRTSFDSLIKEMMDHDCPTV